MAANPFDQFDKPSANPFDQFDQKPAANPFDQFDRAERQATRPSLVRAEPVVPPAAPTVTAPEPFRTSAERFGAAAEVAAQAPGIASPEEMLTPLGEPAAKKPAAAKPVALPTDPSKLQEGILYKDRAGREYYWDASSKQLNKTLPAEKTAPKSGSVFDEVVPPKTEALPGENRFGMNPEFVKAVEAQLNALPESQRGAALNKLLARKDLYGRAAQDIQARYQQLGKLKTTALKRAFDPRLESQAAKLAIEGGMDPEAAQAWAAKELRLGRMPTILPQAVPDQAAELAQAEADRVRQEMEGAGFLDRVGAEMGTRMRQSSLGAAQIYADISGDKELDQRLRGLRQVEEARGEAIPKGDTIFERSAQQAIATLATTAPMKVLGAMTGFAAPVLSQMAFETFTTAYGQSRSAFKDPMEASIRAGLMTTAEVLFERFGLGDQFKAIRGVVNGIPTKELSGYLSKAFMKEVPAELATTTSNFITDLAPQIGLNQNAGLKDYFEQAGETIRQTVIQGGASIGAVRGAAAAEQAYSTQLLPAISPERAVARAIRQGAEQAEPTPAALRALSVTGGLKSEPPQIPVATRQAEPPAEPPPTAPPQEQAGRIEPTIGEWKEPAPSGQRVEPKLGDAGPRIPGMPTGEEVEEGVTNVTPEEGVGEPTKVEPKTQQPQAPFFTPRGVGPQFKGSVAPTPAAARLPDTPTVAPTTQPKVFEPAAPQHQDLELPSVEVPLSQLKLSKDVPQFKYGASKTGVVKPLGGKFSREGLAPIAVWERLDGSLEIISGRHRFDLAQRSGEKTIPSQIYRERDGFTAVDAAIKDAELNIRDDQGQVKDYVNYFKESGMDRETAESKGLLARDKGKRGFTIGNQGSDELIEALRADKVSDTEAYYIALNAPNDSRLQAVGIKAIMDGKSANVATNMMQAVKALASENDTTLDMFGFDDSAIKEAEEMAKIAQKKQREVSDRLSAISGAAKRPEIAKAEGIDIKDPEAVKRRIDELRNLKAAWDNWSTNPELIAQIREARGVEAPKPFGLTAQTPEELEAQDRARKEQEAKQKAEEEERERKAKADEEVGEFVLTGSDREADEAAARGQEDLFAAPQAKKEPAKEEPKKEPANIRQARKELEESKKAGAKELTPAELKRRRELIAFEEKQRASEMEEAGKKVVNGKKPDPNLPADKRLVLMPCCDTKGEEKAPAMDLYKGVFFQTLNSKQQPGATPNIFILSAKHGFIEPTKEIEPYDQMMTPGRAQEFLTSLQRDLDKIDWPEGIQDVMIVGGKEYQRVMRAAVAQLQKDGIISKDASINATTGGIGEQRKQLGQYLESIGGEPSDVNETGFRGASDQDVAEVGQEFQNAIDRNSDDESVTKVFDPPKKNERVRIEEKVRVYVSGKGYMTVAEAKKQIEEWKKHTQAQGETRKNSDKVVLSLFDLTGEWSKPWEEAGYQVFRFDIQDDPELGDVNNFDTQFFADNFGMFEGQDVYAILAACPCTDFASSGARHFDAKDRDGRTIKSVDLVNQTLATIEFFKPSVWAIENPVGRIEGLTGLPPWRMSFQPSNFGDPYTKRTLLWGRFNGDLPTAPVEPTEGSKMHRLYGGKSQATKNARSVTPEGFAYAFFMANNAVDNPVMAVANKYDMMDRKVFEEAVDAGMSDQQIAEAVDESYYQNLDYRAAEDALRARIQEIKRMPVGINIQDFAEYVDSGLNTEYPNVADALEQYTRKGEIAGLVRAQAEEEYSAYKEALVRMLRGFFPEGKIPVAFITKYAGYGDAGSGPVSVSINPNWGLGSERLGVDVLRFSVSPEDVIAAGNGEEGELIISREAFDRQRSKSKDIDGNIVLKAQIPNGMSVHVFKTSDGYGAGLFDNDSGNYVNGSIIRYKGADALTKAKKKAQEIAAEATPSAYTPEQRKNAEAHAKDIGGEIVWQEGDNALIRGYSALTGDPVYIPTFGTSRARVDVSSFTGTQIPAAVRDKMLTAKALAETEAEDKHATDPFIKFENGVALSDGIDPNLAGVIREWKDLLKLNVPVYVSTIEDAKENKGKFTGPHRRIGSGTLDDRESGSMRMMQDGSYYILFKKSSSPTRMLEVIAHEMGHLHERMFFESATPEEKAALRAAHQKFLESQKGKTAKEFVLALRGRATGRAQVGKASGDLPESELGAYWKSFGEWYADQTAKWAVSSAKPVSIVEKYFKRLAIQLRRFFQQLKARKYLPDETFAQYMEKVTERPANLEPKASDRAERMSTDVSGQRAPVTFREDIPNENWLNGKIQYAKSRPRDQFGVPAMSSTTGYFSRSVYVPVRWLKDLKGERGEQQNIRQRDLDGIREVIRSTGQLPLTQDGKVYAPYIEIGYDGVPWVNEGNHRIMAAVAEGLDYIPIELKYFDGGQRNVDAKWKPQNILDIQGRGDIQERFGQVPLYNINEFRSPLGYYSALSAGIDGMKISIAPAQGWKDAIKGLINKGQAKADEVEWSGINDWLDLQQGKVSKDAVLEYLNQGGVRVEETVLGGNRFKAIKDGYIAAMVRQGKSPDGAALLWEEMQAFAQNEEDYNEAWKNEGFDLVIKDGRYTGNEIHDVLDGTYETKYGTYTLPGGQNYREVLLTLPAEIGGITRYQVLNDDGELVNTVKTREAADRLVRGREGFTIKPVAGKDFSETYLSSHWDQPNILAHIRINDRTDADGKRVLFVEEIQSDWGQAGKKSGFKRTADQLAAERERLAKEHKDYVREESNALSEELRGIKTRLRELPAGQDRDEATRLRNREESIYRQLRMLAESRPSEPSDSGIPAAPFVTKTEGWLNLALKRIMVMAAEGGYDRVAFVNGEQSVDRYDLSKKISELRYDGDMLVALNKYGRIIISKEVAPAELPDVVGKEVADKLINSPTKVMPNGYNVLSGLDLKLGGEGMKTFYDKIVPMALNKLLPKVGGGKAKTVEAGGEKKVTYEDIKAAERRRDFDEAERLTLIMERQELGRGTSDAGEYQAMQQLGFDITPAMRETVAKGIPLFSVQEPSLAEQEGDLLFTSPEIREEKIKQYAKLRASVTRMTKQIAEGKASIDLQRNLTQTMQAIRELQAEIKETVPRSDSPEDFYAKALKEYSAGNISEEVLDVIKAMYQRHPEFLNGLLLSVTQGKNGFTTGSFVPWTRIVRLYKSTSGVRSPQTIRHEIAHSLEQLMTDAQRKVVIQAWGKALQRAIKQNPDDKHQEFFNAVNNFLSNPTERSLKEAIKLLPSYSMYQYVSPSEFWAVNSEKLMAAELGTAWDRFKSGVRRLFEALKKVLGFDNRSDVHNVFRQIMTGDITDRRQTTLVDVFGKFELQNIQDEKDLLDRYARPNTPKLDNTPIRTFVIDQFKNGKDLIKEASTNPTGLVSDQATNVVDGLIAARTKAIWYGAGLESRDFDQYKGQIRTGEGAVIASVALDNAIRSGNIGVEVLFRGGIEYNPKQGNYVAVERDLGMRGVYEAEAKLKKKLGDQVGTDIIQAYLEAKRSISIMNEFRDRTEALENAKKNLDALKQMGAMPDDIKQAQAEVDDLTAEVDSISKAKSSVNMSEDEMYEFAARDQVHPELADIMKNWSAINQNLLRMWRQVGLLSQGRYETLSKIKDYVPWYRITSDDEDLHAPPQTAIQSTTRSMTNIGREKLFKRGKPVAVMDFRAKAGQKDFKIEPSSVVRVKVNDKPIDPALVKATASGEVRVDMNLKDNDLVTFETNREIQNIIDNMTRNVMRMTMNGIRQFAANRIVLEYATRNTENKIKLYSSVDRAKGRFNWVVNGRKVVVEIQDPLVASSIYGMDNLNLKMWAPLAAVANLVRRTVTLSPDFQISQVLKDAPTAAMVTGVRNPIALIGGVLKGFTTALVQPAIKKAGADVEPVIDVLKAAGIGGFHSPARTPEAEIKRRLGIMNRNVFSAMIKALDHIGDSSDMAQRVAVYKRVLAETGDETQALFQAANVINFLHHGSAGTAQAIVKVVPFMGAYANSIDVLMNALIGGGLKGMSRKRALARLASTTTMLMTVTILYCMLVGGDPEYDELDDQTKLRNVIVPGTKIAVPMNTSASLFWKAIPELIYNKVTREGTENEYDARRLRRALSQIARDSLLGPEPVPAGLKPILEVGINYSFFTGRSVIPEGMKGVEAAEQYVASTSELGKKISELLEIPGTDGRRVLSPIEADHIMRGIFGTAATIGQWVTNRIAADAGTRPELTERETPMLGKFMRPELPRGREDLYYDLKEEVERKYKTYMKKAERDSDDADKYLDKNEGLIAMHEYITEADENLQEINAEIRRLATTHEKISAKDRRKEITELEKLKQDVFEPVKELRREVFK